MFHLQKSNRSISDFYFCTAAWQDELAIASYMCVYMQLLGINYNYQMTTLLRVIHFVTEEKCVAMLVVTLLLKIATCRIGFNK